MSTCPPTTTADAAPHLPEWAIVVICVLGVIVLVLTVTIVAVFCRLSHLSRYDNVGIILCIFCVHDINTDSVNYRIKGSGPVLITRLNHCESDVKHINN